MALASVTAALALAAQHPLSAPLALAGVLAMAWLTLLRPGAWLFWLPALLPVLSAAPWTGWWLLDELDLFVLAVLAGGYARWALALVEDFTQKPGEPFDKLRANGACFGRFPSIRAESFDKLRTGSVEAPRADRPALTEGLAKRERLNPDGVWPPPDETNFSIRAESFDKLKTGSVEAPRADRPALAEGLAKRERLNPDGVRTPPDETNFSVRAEPVEAPRIDRPALTEGLTQRERLNPDGIRTPPDEANISVRAEPVEALCANRPELAEGLNPHGAFSESGAGRPCGPGRAADWPGWRGSHGLGWLCLALAATLLLGTLRGWLDAGGLDAGSPGPGGSWAGALTASHSSVWNTPRVAKSLLWALLLLPLLRHAVARGLARHFATGMLAGLLLVGVLVLWERHQFAGVFDFTQPYRTSAGFWEMHVGGGAIDAYLALALPFACWAVWTAPSRLRWAAALLLLALGLYAVLTTYSRGVALAVLLSLGVMLLLARLVRLQPAAGMGWRGGVQAVALLLAAEVALVLGGGAVLSSRLARSNADLMGRVAHWQAGLGLLQTPTDGLLGLGLGRLPAHYSRRVPGGEFPGQAAWANNDQGHGALLLSGPPTQATLAREFGLTQRVRLDPGGVYEVRWAVEPVTPVETNEANKGGLAGGSADQSPPQQTQPDPNKPHSKSVVATPSGEPQSITPVRLFFSLCERHLLYSGRCQERVVTARSGPQSRPLRGPAFERTGGVFSVAVLGAGQAVRLQRVQLLDPQGRPVLRNAGFTQQLQHWWPSAQGQFQPWHIDSLYLELLIERGALGLGVMAAWLAWAAVQLQRRLRQRDDLAWALSGALLGLLALGAVVSVAENPRVALLAMLCMWLAEPRFQAKPHTPEGAEK